jgi:hypothetical protein
MKPWSILFFVIIGLTILTLAIAWGDDSTAQQVRDVPCKPKAQLYEKTISNYQFFRIGRIIYDHRCGAEK